MDAIKLREQKDYDHVWVGQNDGASTYNQEPYLVLAAGGYSCWIRVV